MNEDGGPAYPHHLAIANPEGGFHLLDEYGLCEHGMSLRERFAVAIAGNPSFFDEHRIGLLERRGVPLPDYAAVLSRLILEQAQYLADEAMKRRGDDASELQTLRTENAAMKTKIAEFIDGERHGEPEPRPGDE